MVKIITKLAFSLFLVIVVFNTSNCVAQNHSYLASVNNSASIADDGQALRYNVRPQYLRPMSLEVLGNAKLVSEIIPGYPLNWINSYVAVEILVTTNKQIVKAVGLNELLTAEQKTILRKADPGTEVVVNVKYKYKEPASNEMLDKEMHASVTAVSGITTVAPENDASFKGGYPQMVKYFNKNGILPIFEKGPKVLQQAVVGFTVNADGAITNTKIVATSGDTQTDALLLESIAKMPIWIPAKDLNGSKVQQEFIFNVGMSGC